MKSCFSTFFFLLITTSIYSQKFEYAALLIPDSLKQNANAVVRLDQTDITIASQRDMTVATKRIVTVLNEKGMRAIGAIESYDKKTSIRSIEATVYDGFGNEIKKIRRKDFRDESATDDSTLFSDDRVIYLHYTPISYPFTVVYECEVSTSNTAFIPQWFALELYSVSVEKAMLNVSFAENLGFKKKESNLARFAVQKTVDTAKQLSYTAANIMAQKDEYGSPDPYNYFPKVMMALEHFNLEGVDGNAKDWKEFGRWYFDQILVGTSELSDETKTKILALVGNETDPIQKAKIIYNYVQQKSRYVGIQVGIGGWKPMPAKDVDRLGYGDCKALTNYTKALLGVVGVASYNTLLYGDSYKRDIESDFVSTQGNHMMLSLPDGDHYIFLECTSQDDPFGYQANFTDDRNVLIIKPEGGVIVRTKNYQNNDNAQQGKGNFTIAENGDFSGTIAIISEGAQYSKFKLESKLPNEKEAYYKKYWYNISNLKLEKVSFSNDKEKVKFTENMSLSATGYGAVSGNRMMVVANAFNQYAVDIKRIRNRKTPFEIGRGSYDSDEITIALPAGFALESIPKDFALSNKFGEYKTELVKKDESNLVYKRSLLIKKGIYTSDQYEEYRLFLEQVSRNDNAKIILIKT
ncbi:MAG TPA: DUF3857 domain-containing protein [Flavobacterium sp.]|nr:DUF3857 domain-containing protein [Flavobacterium sp.]